MRLLVTLAAGLVALASPAAALTLSNAPYPVQQTVAPFGTLPGSSPTYGQVFVLPASGTLTSFSFTLTGSVGQIFAGLGTWNGGYSYTAGHYDPDTGIYIPDGGSPTTLWDSRPTYVSTQNGQTTYTFTPNVPVLNLTQYVAYISVFGSPDAAGSTQLVLGNNAESAFRYFTFDNGAGDPSGNPGWLNYENDVGDALFSVTVENPVFPPPPPGVPEPAAWALMIGGFGLVGMAARRRRLVVA